MRAITVRPGDPDSARLDDVAEPAASDGAVLVRTLALGICGTDREIAAGHYGIAPEGRDRLILGHEALGEVLEAPPDAGLARGDRVVGIVRRPDPVPCASCAAGEWDMCRNGRYTERGIKALDGFGAERVRIEPGFAVRVDPALGWCGVLVEPASVLAKAWEQVEYIGRRAAGGAPRSVLVTGAGPVGLLAAMIGVQRGLEVHVFDRVTEGVKPGLVRDLGAVYHAGSLADLRGPLDVVLECTGAPAVVHQVLSRTGPLGIVCLTGISSGGRTIELDLGAVSRAIVLENDTVFGSVNAGRRHYEAAARHLRAADPRWLDRLISHRFPLGRWREALRGSPEQVKVIVDFTG